MCLWRFATVFSCRARILHIRARPSLFRCVPLPFHRSASQICAMPLLFCSLLCFAVAERIFSVLCRCNSPLIRALPLLFVASPSFAFADQFHASPLRCLPCKVLPSPCLAVICFASAIQRDSVQFRCPAESRYALPPLCDAKPLLLSSAPFSAVPLRSGFGDFVVEAAFSGCAVFAHGI